MRVSIVGNIGCGKSTLLKAIEPHVRKVVYEPVDKWSILPLFYEDMDKWSFAMQVQVLQCYSEIPDDVIIERSPWEALNIFSKNLVETNKMTNIEYELHEKLFAQIGWTPDVVIYLKLDVDTCYERIKQRSRECESTIPYEYLQSLNVLYEKLVTNAGPRVYIIDAKQNSENVSQEALEIIQSVSGVCNA